MRVRLLCVVLGLLAYTLAGFPLLLAAYSTVRRRPVVKGDVEPTYTIIIAAHNEERVIGRKLDSILEQNYPRDRLQVIVASDGSTDGTCDIVRGYRDQGVTLLDRPRAGKAATLNHAAAQATGDIIVFTDANAILDRGCLLAIARNFNDPSVGGVSANERRLSDGPESSAGLGERLYWEYDKWLKGAESRSGSMVSASGSLYAIRRDLFIPIADPAATDDFSISTQVVVAGRRLVFEPDAVTWEPPIAKESMEFSRRARIVTRGLRGVWGIRQLLLPWRGGFYSVQLWSHKVLRRLVGAFAMALLALTIIQPRRWWSSALLLGQLAFYALAAVGWKGQSNAWARKPWFLMPYYFCLSNAAATLGVIRFLRGRTVTVWEPRRDE